MELATALNALMKLLVYPESQRLTNNYKNVEYNDGEMRVLTRAYNRGTQSSLGN